MNVLSFRLSANEATSAGQVASAFVQSIASRNFAGASANVGSRVQWFGETIESSEWTERISNALGASVMVARLSGELQASVLMKLDREIAEATLDGPVRPDHSLRIFDFRRDDVSVSIGVLVAKQQDGKRVVERVIDLRRLKKHVLSRSV